MNQLTLTKFLNFFDFDYVIYDSGKIGLIDNQEANLGDIQDDRFPISSIGITCMVERMDTYYDDYIFNEIIEDLRNHKITVDCYSYRDIVETYKKNKDYCQIDYDYEIMIAEHILNPELIKLDNIGKEARKEYLDEYKKFDTEEALLL